MKRAELEKLAQQSKHSLDKAERYRNAAKSLPDGDIDRERLLAAAKAIEITALEWTRLAQELAVRR